MAAVIQQSQDELGTTVGQGFSTSWDWKGSYVSNLQGGNNETNDLERFSQYSATPDSTMLFAGPARFTGLAGNTAELTPIGLTDGIALSQNPMLQRLYEIGSNRAYFTRGKTQSSVSFSRVLADQQSILMALSANTYRPLQSVSGPTASSASPNPNVALNLDSEYFATPFGLMLLFKTRGGGTGSGGISDTNGKILCSIYLEYCMFENFQFQVANQSPVIMENISCQFDRVVPVAFLCFTKP
jgi:hypothetical protein